MNWDEARKQEQHPPKRDRVEKNKNNKHRRAERSPQLSLELLGAEVMVMRRWRVTDASYHFALWCVSRQSVYCSVQRGNGGWVRSTLLYILSEETKTNMMNALLLSGHFGNPLALYSCQSADCTWNELRTKFQQCYQATYLIHLWAALDAISIKRKERSLIGCRREQKAAW